MRFKTKDLMVTVLPEAGDAAVAKACLLGTVICRHPTFCTGGTACLGGTFCGGGYPLYVSDFFRYSPRSLLASCGFLASCLACSKGLSGGCGFGNSCGRGGSACDFTDLCPGGSIDPWVIEHIEDLTAIRAELVATLKQLDEMKSGLKSSIASKAEADSLESALNDALNQVRAAKKGLK